MTKTLFALLCFCLPHMVRADNHEITPADLVKIEAMQRHVDKLGFGALGANHYALSKARAWLDLALDEYHEKDRTGIVQDAAAQAAALLAALDNNPAFDASDTPHPYASEKVRDDLWEKVDAMKKNKEFPCAARKIAELEIQLVWTGHEKWESGWSHAEPYARIAENLAYEAQTTLDQCALQHAPRPVAQANATVEHTLTIEKRTLSTDTMFAFNRYGVEYLVLGGRQKLDKLVAELKSWKSLTHIDLTGHTDRLGKDAYNQTLSQRRAEQIRLYLVSHDIPASVIQASGLGETQPLVECKAQRSRHALIECLQPNRRVEFSIQGTQQ